MEEREGARGRAFPEILDDVTEEIISKIISLWVFLFLDVGRNRTLSKSVISLSFSRWLCASVIPLVESCDTATRLLNSTEADQLEQCSVFLLSISSKPLIFLPKAEVGVTTTATSTRVTKDLFFYACLR